MEEEKTMPVAEAVAPTTESEIILIAAVKSINSELPPVNTADELDDADIVTEPLENIENGEVELEKEQEEALSVSIDTSGDDESKMLQESNDTTLLQAYETDATVLAFDISTDDENLMDELHDGSFNTSETVAESDVQEEEIDDEDNTVCPNDVELIPESSNSSASSSEDDEDREDDETEEPVKLPATDLGQAIEIDDDDDDEEQDPKSDDEFDEDSENQSYSDENSRSSVDAIHDDDEEEEEHEEDFGRLVEMNPIKISEVKTIPKKQKKRGPIKIKGKTIKRILIDKSIKYLSRRMHDYRRPLAASKLRATVEQLCTVKPAIPNYAPTAMTKEALPPMKLPLVEAKKPTKPPIRIIEEISMIDDSDDEIESHVNGVTQLAPVKNEPEPTVSAPNDVTLQTPANVAAMEMSSPTHVKVIEFKEATPIQPKLEPAAITVAKEIPASVEAVPDAMEIEQIEPCQQNGETVKPPSTLPAPITIAEPSAEIRIVSEVSVPIKVPETVPEVPSEQIAPEPVVLSAASDEKQFDQRPTGRTSNKRTLSVSSEEMPPSKRIHAELEDMAGSYDRHLLDIINKTTNNNSEELQGHLVQLEADVKNLEDLAKAKENEWNKIVHMKKVKEEVILRLKRRQTIMTIMATNMGGDEAEFSILDTQSPSLSKRITKELQQSILLHNNNNNNNIMLNSSLNSITMVPLVSSTPNSTNSAGISTAQSILSHRVNMKSSDLAKQKAQTDKLHRNILPKPGHSSSHQTSSSSSSPILNNYMISASKTAATAAASPIETLSVPKTDTIDSNQRLQYQIQHQAFMNAVMMNGGASSAAASMQNTQTGRQGPIKDVKSIIDDYRQKHPEGVPRRGRRLKGTFDIINAAPPTDDDGPTVSSSRRSRSTYPVYYDDAGRDSTRHQRRPLPNTSPLVHRDFSDLSSFLNRTEGNSRPPSNGSSHSNSNVTPSPGNSAAFFNELLEFAKYAQHNNHLASAVAASSAAASPGRRSVEINHTSTPIGKTPPGYPEVTLHPVSSPPESAGTTVTANTQASPASPHNNSLLHGILTKVYDTNPRPVGGYTSFAPTLARLLTAPERITPLAANIYQNHSPGSHQRAQMIGSGRTPPPSTSLKSEITITPVEVKPQTLLQQQLQRQHDSRAFLSNVDDEADDSVDRLVIDEGENNDNSANLTAAGGKAAQEEDTPECQGCKKREAQFVCAGCGNQWYCSRDCQVTAWDEHSEVCTG